MRPRTLRRALPLRHCIDCGREYSPYRDWQKFCSTKCRNTYFWKYREIVVKEAVPVETET
jgi:predicted nucleic acid-binding Zn ribbon protein